MGTRGLIWAGAWALLAGAAAAQDLTWDATWDAGTQPGGMVLSADGARLFVADAAEAKVRMLSTATGAVSATVSAPSGRSVRSPVLSPDGILVYVPAPPDRVLILDSLTGALAAVVAVPAAPSRIAFSRDGGVAAFLVLSAGSPARLSVFDTDLRTVVGEVPLPQVLTIGDLALTPDGTRALVTSSSFFPTQHRVLVVDIAARTVAQSVTVPAFPLSLAVSADGAFAYAACWSGQAVVEIDIAAGAVARTFSTTGHPFLLSWAAGQSYLWALCETPGEMIALDLGSGTAAGAASVPGAQAGRSGMAFRYDGKIAVVAGSDASSVYLVSTNPVADTFGQTAFTLAVGRTVTDVAFDPSGLRAFVAEVTTGAALVVGIGPALDSLFDGIVLSVQEIDALLADPTVPAAAKTDLNSARTQLVGARNGQAANGAITKLLNNQLTAALSKIVLAIQYLKSAAAKGADTLALQWSLAEGARLDTLAYIIAKEQAGANAAAAWGFYNQGVALQDAGDYEGAVRKYKDAVAALP